MTRLRRWEVQYAVHGETFRYGYGYFRAFTQFGALLGMLMHYMEYGHAFHYRLMHGSKQVMLFPGDLFDRG